MCTTAGFTVACHAGVEMGGRKGVRRARSARSRSVSIPPIALRALFSRFALKLPSSLPFLRVLECHLQSRMSSALYTAPFNLICTRIVIDIVVLNIMRKTDYLCAQTYMSSLNIRDVTNASASKKVKIYNKELTEILASIVVAPKLFNFEQKL